MNTTIETITPQIAASYLAHNIQNNRNIKRDYVEMMARDMAAGAFHLTHQGIAFDENGNLIDGQHRLNAVLASNTPVRMMVTRGLATGTIEAVDKGARRSVHDTLIITSNGSDERSRALRHRDVINAITQMTRLNAAKSKVSPREVCLIFERYEDSCCALMRSCTKGLGKKNGSEMAACLSALINGVPEESVGKFMQVFREANISGCDQYNVQVVLSWRHYIDNLKAKHLRLNDEMLYKTTKLVLWHFVNNTRVSKITEAKENKYDVSDEVKAMISRRF